LDLISGFGAVLILLLSLPAGAFDLVVEDGAISTRPISPPTMFDLLSGSNGVEKEIELDKEQRTRLNEIREQESQAVMESMQLLQSGKMSGETYKSELLARKVVRQAQIKEMLLPHQFTRLQQIVAQKHVARAGSVNAILHNEISDRLGITDDQRKKLEEKAQEIENRLRDQIEKLRAEAKDELLSVLTKKQRDEFASIIGEKFQPRDKDVIESFRNEK
jgi:predicted Zn-dependent protease with MMP-like domain